VKTNQGSKKDTMVTNKIALNEDHEKNDKCRRPRQKS